MHFCWSTQIIILGISTAHTHITHACEETLDRLGADYNQINWRWSFICFYSVRELTCRTNRFRWNLFNRSFSERLKSTTPFSNYQQLVYTHACRANTTNRNIFMKKIPFILTKLSNISHEILFSLLLENEMIDFRSLVQYGRVMSLGIELIKSRCAVCVCLSIRARTRIYVWRRYVVSHHVVRCNVMLTLIIL